MSEAAGLAADPGQLAIGVVQEIRQDQQQGRHVRPAVGAGQEGRGPRQSHEQTHAGQVIRGNPGILEGRDQLASETGVPGTLDDRSGIWRRTRLRHECAMRYAISEKAKRNEILTFFTGMKYA